MRAKILSFALVVITMLLSGCTQAQITTKADELMAYKWSASDKHGKEISLLFYDDIGHLTIKTDDISCEITGTALVDEHTVKIFDSSCNQSYSFDYVLYGNKIDITYNEKTIGLNKVAD